MDTWTNIRRDILVDEMSRRESKHHTRRGSAAGRKLDYVIPLANLQPIQHLAR